jgi:2-oxoglutarate dehydrogenase E2 component (dihydrolipoamide succinyltransferase)
MPSKRDAKYGPEEIIPMEGRRRVIAEKLALSKRTVADLTTFMEVDVTEMMVLRRESNVTVTSYIARAVVEGLKEYPALNSSLLDENIIIKYYINLGIAVDLEEGLVVPVIHNVQDKNLIQIAKELSELTQKAHDGKLSRENLEGGTFTITNSGVLGSSFFTPIINYPEGAILGMGKIERKPVVVGEEIVIRQMMYLAVTYDHRIIDGGSAVRFLKSVKNHLEDPLSFN